ncbi:(2Fe-2S)-binding protein [Muricauda sp. CAU 1633]|uniref:2Fe-2S iron-sulfur cluster-binding protein n=1 Tax=Allomuricauda sp. CAU 1633 TaxID=2816036 RepID=UPI001A8FB67C|nr:2Fe-2S iron-sulfur cluster-binding protein [Muricauda sp. CAU 1633]MBO0323781.1 (2Fe-2S)-binding protein [Muricauda sp. CAU 1633]
MQITVVDTANETQIVPFKRYEYANLMELIVNTCYDEIGECRGRGLCGTCVVEIGEGSSLTEPPNKKEMEVFQNMNLTGEEVRLACQLMLTHELDGVKVRVLEGY